VNGRQDLARTQLATAVQQLIGERVMKARELGRIVLAPDLEREQDRRDREARVTREHHVKSAGQHGVEDICSRDR
jgi:hypothetical protein